VASWGGRGVASKYLKLLAQKERVKYGKGRTGSIQTNQNSTEHAEQVVPTGDWRLEIGWVKANLDAGYCPGKGLAGPGVVVRNHQGSAVLSAWKFMESVGSAVEAQALACLEGVRLATAWVSETVLFQSDCMSPVFG
jgi:hypothetical protein